MTARRLRRIVAAVATLAAVAALPASASAAAVPYSIALGAVPGELDVTTVAVNSTLAVQVHATATDILFTPPAAIAPGGCTVVPFGLANATSCPATMSATTLKLSGAVLDDVRVTGITTTSLVVEGGPNADAITVDEPAAPAVIGTVSVTPGDGADAVTISGRVNAFALIGADPGNDRYTLSAPSLTGTLALGAGNDIASSTAGGLTLAGGPGDDTLRGQGPLDGGADNDLLQPTAPGRAADGGPGDDLLSYDAFSTGLDLRKSGTNVALQGDPVTKTGIERLQGGQAGDTITADAGSDELLAGGEGDDTIAGGGGADHLDGGPGNNLVSYASATGPVNVDLAAGTATLGGQTDQLQNFRRVQTGEGNDSVFGTTADEEFSLGGGDDVLNAGPGNDIIDGGAGNDLLRGGHGTDIIAGGPGTDTATYDERTASEPLSITLATAGDDGAPGENDTLAGIENVVGGASNDVIVGDDGPNVLIGGSGVNTLSGLGGDDVIVGGDFRDIISGGPGSDQLFGGGDDDSIDAFDNEPDVVDCGPSTDDDAQVDAGDQVVGCEYARRGDVPVPVDADGDGSVAGFDCNDADPLINPGATDIPGDGIDQNCDGFDEPLPLVAGKLRVDYVKNGRGFKQLVVAELQAGSTVVATCKARVQRKCPFKRVALRAARAGASASFTKRLRRKRLPAGARIELRITAPGTVGRFVRFSIRGKADPRVSDLCLLPGSSVAKKCPPDVV